MRTVSDTVPLSLVIDPQMIVAANADENAHLSDFAVSRLLKSDCGDATFDSAFPHLISCSVCRDRISNAINMFGAKGVPLAVRFLGEAKEWAQWDALGRNASERTRRELLEKGIGYVYGKEGNVYRRMPDGSDQLIWDAGVG